MASKTFVVLEDDIDGSEGAETVTFALDVNRPVFPGLATH